MPIMLQFQLTADDYIAANLLHMRWTRARWIRTAVVMAALIAFTVVQMPGQPVRAVAIAITAYGSAMALVVLVVRYVYMPWRARRIFAQSQMLQRPFTWTWNDDEVRFKTDLANAVVPWSHLVKWRESSEVILLYASDLMFYVIPKRAFADANAVGAFRALLQTKIASPSPPQAAF